MRFRRPRLVTLLSLLPCALLLALWVRSGWWTDSAWYGAERSTFGVNSEAGRVLFVWAKGPYPPLGFASYRGRHRSPWWHHVKHLVVFRAFDSGNRSWVVQVPHWAVAAAAVVPVVRHRRRSRRPPGHCPECGYDLRATPDACPECGYRPGAGSIEPRRRGKMRPMSRLVCTGLMLALAAAAGAAPVPDDWAFRRPQRPAVPASPPDRAAWVRNPIDAFVLAKQQEQGLSPSPEADRRTLVRRLTFDLTGLPPTPQEVKAFVEDRSADAYEKLVDRLLASPAYGERWARHWLDVVHYGESHGYDKDKPRPNAWPYRDYVIRSFNDDKPYARFVREQLAGDVLDPGAPDGIVATGFIAAGPWDFVGHMELREGTVDKEITRSLDRDDMVMTAASTFLSLTVHCARCHDHKFDPIKQDDYYRLQAVFAGVDRGERHFADPALPKQTRPVYAAVPLKQPRAIHLLNRGDVKQPKQEMAAGTLEALAGKQAAFTLVNPSDEGQRRAALAQWLTRPDNLLLRRSIVNRVWHYHFGRGIVETPNDFGKMGSRPTHPELLDWLAYWFLENGESIKSLHRLIVTSSTYRQSSSPDRSKEKSDADNRYLWRMNRSRLDAESTRDAVLAVSGRLDRTMFGPSVQQFAFKDDHSPVYDYAKFDPDSPGADRRSVYRFIVRSVPDPLMDTLDCPDASLLSPKRNTTLTALQALSLLNNPFMTRQAEHLAERVAKEAPDLPAQVAAAFELATARPPTADEAKALGEYARHHGLANACRVILNSNEFVFVD